MIFLVALGTADLFRAVLFWCMDLYFLIRHSHPQLEGNGKVVRLVMLGLIGVFSVVVSTDPDYEDLRIPFILWLVTWLAFGVLNAKAEALSNYPEYGSISFRKWPVWRRMRVLLSSGVLLLAFSILVFAPTDAPTISALIVSGCTPNECEWEKITKENFGFDDRTWEDGRKRGNYIVINKTGGVLKLKPIEYSRLGSYGIQAASSIIVPTGMSVQQKRPSYVMEAVPGTIRTKSSEETRWQLMCRY